MIAICEIVKHYETGYKPVPAGKSLCSFLMEFTLQSVS